MLGIPQREEVLHESLEKIAKRLVNKIKLCLQGFNSEDYNVNIVTGNNPYQGITLDVDIEQIGEFNKTNIFKISYQKYNGLDFTWKFVGGYNQTEKNKLSLDILNFLSTSKFFQHLLEHLDQDLRDVFDKRLVIKDTVEHVYSYRNNALDQLHLELYQHLLSGEPYNNPDGCTPNWGLVNFPFTRIQFERNGKRRSGKLYVQPVKGDVLEFENVTFNRLDAISRAIIYYEVF